eukprot:SAG31_NODE_1209_length_9381_cov_2.526611_1_plen_657_part_00
MPATGYLENFNYRFHNLSSTKLTTDELKLLGMSHKFMPASFGPSVSDLDVALRQFARRLYIKDYFFQREDQSQPREHGKAPDARLLVCNPRWHPKQAEEYTPSPGVEELINDLDSTLRSRFTKLTKFKPVDNLTSSQRRAVRALRQNAAVIIAESNKNMGLCIMDAADYRILGRTLLSSSATELPDAVEDALVGTVRKQLSEILNRHRDLIEGWRGSENDWKRKYLLRAIKRHPKSGEKYRVPSLRLLPKIGRATARDVTGMHSAIIQPFALLDAIQLAPATQKLPNVLLDGDTLTRDLQSSRLPTDGNTWFVQIDIVRLYPTINLDRCIEATERFVKDRLADLRSRGQITDHDFQNLSSEAELDSEIRRVCLTENYCAFDSSFWKFHLGFPTGIANGRELADVYLHTIERSVMAAWSPHLIYAKRYVDDCFVIVRGDRDTAERFIADYGATLQEHEMQITSVISASKAVMLDQLIVKQPNGRLRLQVYQKPLSTYLYIPRHTAHRQHMLRAWIRGELIRYVKRTTEFEDFLIIRRLFYQRLQQRGYRHDFLETIFSDVSYSNRKAYLYGKHRAKLQRALQESTAPTRQPPVLALTLPSTQRARRLKAPEALFSCVQRWTQENTIIGHADFKIAWKNTAKLGQLLLDFSFPRRSIT